MPVTWLRGRCVSPSGLLRYLSAHLRYNDAVHLHLPPEHMVGLVQTRHSWLDHFGLGSRLTSAGKSGKSDTTRQHTSRIGVGKADLMTGAGALGVTGWIWGGQGETC